MTEVALTDRQLLAALESCELPEKMFNHRGHLCAAWQCLEEAPLPQAATRCAAAIRRYATRLGAPGKFHLTLTLTFMHIVSALREQHPAGSAEELIDQCPEVLHDAKGLLLRYYSEDVLFSDIARHAFTLPDRQPLPR